MAKVINIGMFGFGVVGQGFAEILLKKQEEIARKFATTIKICGIYDPVKGCIFDKNGIDLKKALDAVSKGQKIHEVLDGLGEFDEEFLLTNENVNLIIEVTPTNLKTGEPGYTHIKKAIENGKHVITTNKGPIALYYNELKALADKNSVQLKFEGTVLAGTPAIQFALKELAGCEIKEIRGIVNGTTNYILTKMSEGISYEDALKDAQKKGYAETNPEADVEGYDAQAKALILSNVVLNGDLKPDDVEREGITKITIDDINNAKSSNKKIKLIARIKKTEKGVTATVRPELLNYNDPLYHVDGVLNGLVFTTDHLGDVFIMGPGAGKIETGQAILHDLYSILEELKE
ncbi:MAG: homoserine dehydrogenase [bacterium]|nr:homoserine dehydrogenase [bacterium]